MNPVLRYLHLSDFHFRHDNGVSNHNEKIVNDSLLQAIEEQLKEKLIDFIVITGDIAFSGQREEYERALIFCNKLLQITQVPRDRIYIVPGNHDLDRQQITKRQLRFYEFDEQDEVGETLSDSTLRPLLMKKFDEFHHFAEQLNGIRHYDENILHMSQVLRLKKANQTFKLNLLGLNSALFAGYEGDDNQKLALGLFQVEPGLEQLDAELPLSIGFFHHPFSCLHPVEKVTENRLRQQLDLILTGHLHEPQNTFEDNSAGKATIIGAGASYETRWSHNSFNWVEIDLVNGQGIAHFFKYVSSHHVWNRDMDVNPHHPEGLFEFTVPAIHDKPLLSAPDVTTEEANTSTSPAHDNTSTVCHFIHDYLLPEGFTGRKEEQQRLQAILKGQPDPHGGKHASVISICALGGMGKSALARKIFETLRLQTTQYAYLLWFSFYEAHSEDESFLFKEILQRCGQPLPEQKECGIAYGTSLRKSLCQFLDQSPILLVLDGLEVIQHSDDASNPHYSHVKESHKQTSHLLRHLCNQQTSRLLVTSRLPLHDLAGAAGYRELELKILCNEDGAEFLQHLDVSGTKEARIKCAAIFCGHPLTLKAAGHYMAQRHIAANQVDALVGDPAVFQRNSEGERVKKIIDAYRSDLTQEQQYFLKMLSIHPRSVAQHHLSALLLEPKKNKVQIQDQIILPLSQCFLIDVLKGPEGYQYSAHPLMKLAYATWLDPEGKQRAHQVWAKAAQTSPALAVSPAQANNLDELQPWIDIVEHYLEAQNYQEAWDIWMNRGVSGRLSRLAYTRQLLSFGESFELAIDSGNLHSTSQHKREFYAQLGNAHASLNIISKQLSYFKKKFSITKNLKDSNHYVNDGSNLAVMYCYVGEIYKAQEKLNKIKISAKSLQGAVASTYACAQASVLMFSGHYLEAIELYKKSMKHLADDNLILYTCLLGEAQLRAGLYVESEDNLKKSKYKAENEHTIRLLPSILCRFCLLAYKQKDFTSARDYKNQENKLRQTRNSYTQDNGQLLIQEGHYQKALDIADIYFSQADNGQKTIARDIHFLLVNAYANLALKNIATSKKIIIQAKNLMEKSGCRIERDFLEEIEAQL